MSPKPPLSRASVRGAGEHARLGAAGGTGAMVLQGFNQQHVLVASGSGKAARGQVAAGAHAQVGGLDMVAMAFAAGIGA